VMWLTGNKNNVDDIFSRSVTMNIGA